MSKKTLTVDATHHSLKIDRFLSDCGLSLSRRQIRRSLDLGCVSINHKVTCFASSKVYLGDKVQILLNKSLNSKSSSISSLDEQLILYEDEHVIVLNKQPHLLSQGVFKDSKNSAETLLKEYMEKKHCEVKFKLFLCHRLDKETSGVLVFAKSESDCEWIMSQFKHKLCEKVYHAICIGSNTQDSWVRKDYLSNIHPKTLKVSNVKSGGRFALTYFKTISYNKNKNLSFVECNPKTGRSHQIRVQLKLSGLSLLGDKKYCHKEHLKFNAKFLQDHQLLHARSLSFFPSKSSKKINVIAPYPKSFSTIKTML